MLLVREDGGQKGFSWSHPQNPGDHLEELVGLGHGQQQGDEPLLTNARQRT